MNQTNTHTCPHCGHRRLYCTKQSATFVDGDWRSFNCYGDWLTRGYPSIELTDELCCKQCRRVVPRVAE